MNLVGCMRTKRVERKGHTRLLSFTPGVIMDILVIL